MGCNRRVSVIDGLWGVNGDVLREEPVRSHRDKLLL